MPTRIATADAKGATVYVLNEKGASDEAALLLAQRENASDLIGGVSLADKDQMLARVLLDLSQSAALNASMAAGQRLIRRMSAVTADAPARSAAGAVPRAEVAGHSVAARRDGLHLQSARGSVVAQRQVPVRARRRADARHRRLLRRESAGRQLLRCIDTPAPPSRPELVRHVIARGETLSEIAERYRVSSASIRRTNSLRTDVLRVGQVLTIPAQLSPRSGAA